MAAKIKLMRIGKIRQPQYRVVVMDTRKKRDGRAIEEIGLYHPMNQPSFIQIDSDRAQYWLGVGAQPTDAVMVLLKITGDWQKFKGLPGAEGTLKQPEEKTDRKAVFAAAAAEAAGLKEAEAAEPKPKKAEKAEKAKAEEPKAEETPAEEPKAEETPAEEPKAEETPAEETPAEDAPAAEADEEKQADG